MKSKKSLFWRMAKLLVIHASKVLPPERENWSQAMCSEIDHLPDNSVALRWAIGCVFTSYMERITKMKIGNLRVSGVILTIEMLLCFGFLSLNVLGMLFQVENAVPFNGIGLLIFSSSLIGPIGLIFGFRLILLKRTKMSRLMIAALIILGSWTFIINGIGMWIIDAVIPGISWAWGGTLLVGILPALGVAHLIYMSNPEGKINTAAV